MPVEEVHPRRARRDRNPPPCRCSARASRRARWRRRPSTAIPSDSRFCPASTVQFSPESEECAIFCVFDRAS
jgi:hypothetical protein